MMCKINEAYRVLRNIESRKLYDQTLKEKGNYPQSSNVDASGETSNNTTTENKKASTTIVSNNYDEMYEYYNSVDFDEYK